MLADLADVGFDVNEIRDLRRGGPGPYRIAVPILVRWLPLVQYFASAELDWSQLAVERNTRRTPPRIAMEMADGRWATLNNRTLAVARMANLPSVSVVDAGEAGLNKFNQLLRDGGLSGPVENGVMRCK